ncbi:MAG: hypothetical protein KDK10_03670 [Maritimibacter sp.]|nr:hypothetical protein [Maritimibacter sp.]
MDTEHRAGRETEVNDYSDAAAVGPAEPPSGAAQTRAGVGSASAGDGELFPFQPIVLTAVDGDALAAKARRLATRLANLTDMSLAALSQTLIAEATGPGRARVLVVESLAEAAALLEAETAPGVFDVDRAGVAPEVAFLFDGAGIAASAFPHGLYETEPVFHASVEQGLALHLERSGQDLHDALLHGVADARSEAQAVLGLIVEVALARLLMSWGVVPSALVVARGGAAAAVVAGVMSFEDALALAAGGSPDPDGFADPGLPVVSARAGGPVEDVRDLAFWRAAGDGFDADALAQALADWSENVFVALGWGDMAQQLAAAGGVPAARLVAVRAASREIADDRSFVTALARLSGLGVAVDWGQLWDDVVLPPVDLDEDGAGDVSDDASGNEAVALSGPLIDSMVDLGQGAWAFRSDWAPGAAWVLDQLRAADGAPVLSPGIVVALLAEAGAALGLAWPYEIRDLALAEPRLAAPGGTVALTLRLEAEAGGWRARLTGAGSRPGQTLDHASARLAPLSAPAPAPVDFAQIAMRCRDDIAAAEAGATLAVAVEAQYRFGPGWRVLREAARGGGHGLARLSLAPEEHGRLADGLSVHPGLFDLASFWAADMGPGHDPEAPAVAARLGAVRVYGSLPADFASWARSGGGDDAGLDVTLAGFDGAPLIEIEALRLLAADAVRWDPEEAAPGPDEPALPQEEAASAHADIPAETAEAAPATTPVGAAGLAAEPVADEAEAVEPIDDDAVFAPDVPVEDVPDVLDLPATESADMAGAELSEDDAEAETGEDPATQDGATDGDAGDLTAEATGAVDGVEPQTEEIAAEDAPSSAEDAFEATTEAGAPDDAGAAAQASAGPDGAAEETPDRPATGTAVVARAAPVFLLAETHRGAMRLATVTAHLREDRAVHGLLGGFIGDDPESWTIEKAARIHMSEIRRVQPEGPYVIGGIGGDGITALEVARLLRSERQETALVILIDTHPVLDPARALNEAAPPTLRENRRSRPGQLIVRARTKVAESLRRKPTEQELAEAALVARIETAQRAAIGGYKPRPYDMNVTLLVSPSDTSRKARRARKKATAPAAKIGDNGWGRWIPRLEVNELPDDLASLATGAGAKEIGVYLRARVEAAFRNPGETVHWHPAKAAE